MQIGVMLPQLETGPDPRTVHDFAKAADELGYAFITVGEHILGTQVPEGWTGPTSTGVHHEQFVALAYIAGITKKLGLMTGIQVLPMRQTALVAKQAAALDVFSGGRLRLGVGVGWNPAEYQALGQEFHNRGQRIEEQIAVLRALWTEKMVNFEGKWHNIGGAGLDPMPVQRPIPIWLSAGSVPSPTPSDRTLGRVGRIGDGWIPLSQDALREGKPRLERFAREAGRDPSKIGIEGRVDLLLGPPDTWAEQTKAWRDLGATHVSVNTMGAGFGSGTQKHIEAIGQFKELVGL